MQRADKVFIIVIKFSDKHHSYCITRSTGEQGLTLIDVRTQSSPTANMCRSTAPCVRCLLVNKSSGNSWMAALNMRKKVTLAQVVTFHKNDPDKNMVQFA